jgi:L-threonylcarbamoyladenylate synthase
VREEFGAAVPLVLAGGECEMGLESTIVGCQGDELLLLRPGGITHAQLEAVAGPVRRARSGEGPRAPGTTRSHYAPQTPVCIVDAGHLVLAGERADVLACGAAPASYAGPLWIEASRDPQRHAHDLYANLRRLDRVGAAEILVEAPPDDAAWDAIRDRLGRAAAQAEDAVEGP